MAFLTFDLVGFRVRAFRLKIQDLLCPNSIKDMMAPFDSNRESEALEQSTNSIEGNSCIRRSAQNFIQQLVMSAHRSLFRLCFELLGFANLRQQFVSLRGVAGSATAAARCDNRFVVGCTVALERGFRASQTVVDGCLRFSQVALADGESVEGVDLVAMFVALRLRRKVVFEILPVVAAFEVRA